MDWLVIIGWPIVVTFLVQLLHLNFLTSTILFFGFPSLYLSYRRPKLIRKTLIFTLVFAGFFTLILDHMNYLDLSWYEQTSLYRVMGTVPVEDVVWAVTWIYYGVIFWEYFLDRAGSKVKFDGHFKYLVFFLMMAFVLFLILYFANSTWLIQPYFYLKFGILIEVIPLVLIALKFHKLSRKLIAIGLYFLFVSFLHEYVGLRGGHWEFPSQHYIASVKMAGQMVPLEEIGFWWLLGIPGVICWYEYFADDRR